MKIKNLIVFLIAASFFMTLYYAENVRGATADITLANWDDIAAGVNTGTSGLIAFRNLGAANAFMSSTDFDLSLPNSFLATNGGANCNGWWNLTNSYSYIGQINFSFYQNQPNPFNTLYMVFYNSTGTMMLNIGFDNNGFMWQDVSTGWHYLYNYNEDNVRYYLVITHNLTNQFDIKILSSTFVNLREIGYAGANATVFTTFKNIHIYTTAFGIGNPVMYFDNIKISTTGIGGTISTGDTTGYTPICTGGSGINAMVPNTVEMRQWHWILAPIPYVYGGWGEWQYYTETIDSKYIEQQFISPISRTLYAVDLFIGGQQLSDVSSSTSNYFLTVNKISWGNPKYILPDGSGYKLRWINAFGTTLSNEKPTFEFYSVATSAYGRHWEAVAQNPSFAFALAQYHGTDTWYGNGLLDGYTLGGGVISMCYWYNASISDPPCENCGQVIPEYVKKFGNDFIQFLHYDEGCYYGLDYNTNPIIIYNLSDVYLNANSRCFLLEMFKVGSSTPIGFWNINIPDNDDFTQGIETLTDYTFTETGQYYLKLWNTTNYCSDANTTDSELVGNGGNPSMPITVCDKSSNPPAASGGEGGNLINFDFSGLPDFFKILAALFIIIVLTITPYALAVLLSKGNIQVQMPSLVYVAFFFIGVVASVMLGFLDTWVIIIILIGLILTFAILWVQGNKTQGA